MLRAGLVLLVLAICHEPILAFFGRALVTTEPPEPADAILVLAGDFFGGRILKGCELARQGFASRILVSGPRVFFGRHESEMAIPWAVSQGCPAEALVSVPHFATSTRTEAEFFRQYLADNGIRRYLLVTSDFHSARAARVFRETIPGIPFRMVAAPYPEFRPDGWWKHRQSAKTFFFEWVKTVTDRMGI